MIVADDERIVREALAAIIGTCADMEVVAQAGDGVEAAAAARAFRADVVLMDVRMPGGDGIAATARVREQAQAPEVIVLTAFDADDYVFAALEAGAAGFLLKDTEPQQLFRAIREVAAGRSMLAPSVTRRLIEHTRGRTAPAGQASALERLGTLTAREREVLVRVARGMGNEAIAAELFLAEATVKSHVSRILAKTGLTNRVQAALAARDAGWGDGPY
ncbi:DNA-binding response regulator [Zafaria cholistanensis]|uniref:DNA-binding response regulator n=1 Tax=Zafaria cholistanensis TaxID=1682741 RepID=A0A5A7NLX9_9MICC|nr:DNA-binding response regulator [Zafaria cholistanensis]